MHLKSRLSQISSIKLITSSFPYKIFMLNEDKLNVFRGTLNLRCLQSNKFSCYVVQQRRPQVSSTNKNWRTKSKLLRHQERKTLTQTSNRILPKVRIKKLKDIYGSLGVKYNCYLRVMRLINKSVLFLASIVPTSPF